MFSYRFATSHLKRDWRDDRLPVKRNGQVNTKFVEHFHRVWWRPLRDAAAPGGWSVLVIYHRYDLDALVAMSNRTVAWFALAAAAHSGERQGVRKGSTYDYDFKPHVVAVRVPPLVRCASVLATHLMSDVTDRGTSLQATC
jgi:hypothetical protein